MDKDYDKFIPPERKEDVEDEPWWNRARPQGQRQAQMHQQQVPQQQYGQAPAQIPQQAQQQFQGQMQGVPALAGVPQGYGYEDDDDGFSPVKIVAIVIAVVAALLIVGAAFALSHQGEAQDEEPGITQEDEEAAKQASMVYLTVYADGATEETSSCGIKIYKGDSGEDVAKAVNLKCNERGDVGILDAGTYRVHVDTVPSNADGSTYLAPLFDMSFEVAGDGQDMELTLNLDAANVEDSESVDGENADGTQTDGDQVAADGQAVVDGNTGASDAGATDASGSSTATQSGSGGSVQTHQHNWVAQTTTKHHDAVYRTVNHAAVKERRTICDSCKQDITGSYPQHKAASGHSSYHYEYKVTKEAYSEKVLVSAAYDETVTTGYKCSSCGATK